MTHAGLVLGPNYGCIRYSNLSTAVQNFSTSGQDYSIKFSVDSEFIYGFSGEFTLLGTNAWRISLVAGVNGDLVLKYRVISSNYAGTFVYNPEGPQTYSFAVTGDSGIARFSTDGGCVLRFPIDPIVEENTFLQIGDCS